MGRIDKQLFVKLIEIIENEIGRQNTKAKMLEDVLPMDSCVMPDYELINELVELLDGATTNQDWVSYFVWELDCGKNEMANDCVKANDKTYSLKDAAQLYDFLEEAK